MNEHVLLAAPPLTRGVGDTSCAIAQTNPESSRAIAVATFGFALPARDQPPEAGRQPELGLPRDVTHDLRQGFLPVRMLTPDPRNPLIRPRRLGEQASHVRIAGLRDRPAPHPGPTRVFRRHEPEIRHEFARMPKAREVAEFGDEARPPVMNDTPRNACNAATTGAQRQVGAS